MEIYELADKKKKDQESIDSQPFPLVGITGLEPATSRPPDVCHSWAYPALYQGLEPYCNNSVDFVVDFSLPNDLT